MKYICAQPSTQYFGWQIDVMLHSFVTVGVNLENVHVVCAIHGGIDDYFNKLMQKYPGAIFSFYEDTRHDKTYISSIRPHVLKKHFSAYPELSSETIFYHDCDIALTKPLNIGSYLSGGTCYLSDTISYIGHDYIKSKGKDVLDLMCNIVGIDVKTVKANQDGSGGAQYLMKGVDKYFWYDVENDATRLFKEVTELNKQKHSPDYHPIQIWCADMWSVLWNLWKRGKETKVIRELDFSWATSHRDEWHKHAIYHNAGATQRDEHKDLFFKGGFIDKMPDLGLEIKPESCSYMYYKLIQQSLI